MAQGTETRLHIVHPARIEVEAEAGLDEAPREGSRSGHLLSNLGDRLQIGLILGACLAQAADAVTTTLALQRPSLMEANFLMRSAVTQPLAAGALKVLLVVLLSLLAMMRLPRRPARAALFLALAISALAPLQNAVQLLTSH